MTILTPALAKKLLDEWEARPKDPARCRCGAPLAPGVLVDMRVDRDAKGSLWIKRRKA